jgi:hypothetical protein
MGPYPAHKTQYDNVTLRAVNILVETAMDKAPSSTSLGTTSGVLGPANTFTDKFGATSGGAPGNDGHIPRNIRLALAAIDALQPSVLMRGVDRVTADTFLVEYTVRGAANVDKATVECEGWAKGCKVSLPGGGATSVMTGDTRWGETVFRAMVTLPVGSAALRGQAKAKAKNGGYRGSGKQGGGHGDLRLRVVVQVDGKWTQPPKELGRDSTPPQTHWVRSRTDPSWYAASQHKTAAGLPSRVIQGDHRWKSDVFTLVGEVGGGGGGDAGGGDAGGTEDSEDAQSPTARTGGKAGVGTDGAADVETESTGGAVVEAARGLPVVSAHDDHDVDLTTVDALLNHAAGTGKRTGTGTRAGTEKDLHVPKQRWKAAGISPSILLPAVVLGVGMVLFVLQRLLHNACSRGDGGVRGRVGARRRGGARQAIRV